MDPWGLPEPDPDRPSFPVRPYWIDGQPSAGHAKGSKTSLRAERKHATWQERCWDLAAACGTRGVTVNEAKKILGSKTESTVNTAYSTMHEGTEMHWGSYVLALKEERGGCHVYVLPRNVDNRDLEPRRYHKANRAIYAALKAVIDLCFASEEPESEGERLSPDAIRLIRQAMARSVPEEDE